MLSLLLNLILNFTAFVKAQDTIQKAAPISGGIICTQDLCPDGNARDPLTCACGPCVDPGNCPGTWDSAACQCRIPVCDPIWPPPYPANQWLPNPDCKWVCITEKCRLDQIWSAKQCKCLCKQTQSCSARRYWDDNECKCKCREPCKDCADPQIWSESFCNCGCTKEAYSLKPTCNKTLTYWNEQECKCSCWNKPRKCCEAKVWSDEVCDCKCMFNCKCAPGFVWDPYTCNCVCNKKTCPPINGNVRYFDEGSCSCLCENAKYSRCAYGFDHLTCSCRPAICTAKCIEGYEFDKYQCSCNPVGGYPVCTQG